MSKKFFFIGFLVVIFSLVLFTTTWAAYGLEETARTAGLSTKLLLPTFIGNVIGTALSLVGVIFFALMIFGGFLWMTAHGKEEQAKQGMDTVIAAVIGLIIILAAYAITNFVFSSVGNDPSPTNSCANKTGSVSGCDTCVATKGEGWACRNKNNECSQEKGKQVTELCMAPGQGADIVCCKSKAEDAGGGSCKMDSEKLKDYCSLPSEDEGCMKNCEKKGGKCVPTLSWAIEVSEDCFAKEEKTKCEENSFCIFKESE